MKKLSLAAISILLTEDCPDLWESLTSGFSLNQKVVVEKATFEILNRCYPGFSKEFEIKEILNESKREVAVVTLNKEDNVARQPQQETSLLSLAKQPFQSLTFQEEKVILRFNSITWLQEAKTSEGLKIKVKGEINLKRDVYFSPAFSRPIKFFKFWEEEGFLVFLFVPDCEKLDFSVSALEINLFCKDKV